jgi:hypothetical protein
MTVTPMTTSRGVQWNGISNGVITGWVDSLFATDHYGALFNNDPFATTPPTSVEIGGSLYARQDAIGAWDRTSFSTMRLNTALVWRNLPPGTVIAAVGFFSSAFGTTGILHRAMLDVPVAFPAGGTWVLPAGEYSAGVDM